MIHAPRLRSWNVDSTFVISHHYKNDRLVELNKINGNIKGAATDMRSFASSKFSRS